MAAVLGGGTDPASLMVGIYRRARVEAVKSRSGRLRLLVTKPFEYAFKCAGFVRRHGPALRAQFGVSPIRQWIGLYEGWLVGTARPDAFTAYWAFALKRRRKWRVWLAGPQANELLGELAARRAPELSRSIGDKRWFPSWAAENGLPALPLIAVFEGGRPVGTSPEALAAALPAVDLFSKPADLWSGQGTHRWILQGAGVWQPERGGEAAAADVVRALMDQSNERPVVLQRCLRPHPSMAALAPDAISTLRCVTYQSPAGESKLLRATIRLPMPGMIVDNMNAGGMIAAVDPETGVLSPGISWREDGLLQRTSTFPGSTRPVEGVRIALWPEAKRIAIEAQRAAGLPFVGWDLALCEGGPIILEANIRWGGILMSFGQHSPLSDTEFPAVFMHHWAQGRSHRAWDSSSV